VRLPQKDRRKRALQVYEQISTRFLKQWLFAWGAAFLTMLPVVVFIAPFIQRRVLALTRPTSNGSLSGLAADYASDVSERNVLLSRAESLDTRESSVR
jgi:hypothetical protein